MTTDERKTLLDIRNQLVAQIERIDALMEIKEQPKPKPKEQKPTPLGLLRIRRMFGHKDSTLPSARELDAYVTLTKRYTKETFYESVDTMERFYSFRKRKRPDEPDLWSHDSHTLINNWDKKEATAREFLKGKPTSVATNQKVETMPEPKGDWKQYARGEWPNADWDNKSWNELNCYPDIQRQIIENTK